MATLYEPTLFPLPPYKLPPGLTTLLSGLEDPSHNKPRERVGYVLSCIVTLRPHSGFGQITGDNCCVTKPQRSVYGKNEQMLKVWFKLKLAIGEYIHTHKHTHSHINITAFVNICQRFSFLIIIDIIMHV